MLLTPSCQEIDAFFVDYLEGNLPIYRRLVFALHLGMCQKCRAYLRAYRKMIALSKDAYREVIQPPEMPKELADAILATRKGKP